MAAPLSEQIKGLDNRFWIVNVMEMFERLAYYGVRAVVAIYMVLALEEGGPEFTHVQKGTIYAGWAFVQSMLPVFTGGFADRYGHKKTIAIAIAIKIVGYLFMAYFQDYGLFYAGCMLLAAGTAIFKPGVQGTLAATLKDSNASVGWGLFYQLVNVGGFLGPVLAGYLRLMSWKYVFIACAGIVAVNYLWLPFYKDPTQGEHAMDEEGQKANWSDLSQTVSANWAKVVLGLWVALTGWASWAAIGDPSLQNVQLVVMAGLFLAAMVVFVVQKQELDKGQTDPVSVFVVSVAGMFQHRVLWFCIVFSGFWFMFNQVFDLLPNVIDDWVDSSMIITSLGSAFGNPVVPVVLAAFLSVVYGGVCAGSVWLAFRPDRRAPADVPIQSFAVVTLAFAGAFALGLHYAVPGWGGLVALSLGGVVAGIARAMKAPGRPLAIVAWVIAAIGGFVAIRGTLSDSAAELVALGQEGAQINPEWMINLNPGLIVFTMVGFAYLSGFVRPLVSILIGMVIATIGAFVAGTASMGWICLGGILVFSVGEMLSSPKKMEYLATLARKGQEGLFMGYANVPLAIGWVAGSILAGNAYEEHGDKVNLARRHLIELGQDPAAVEALQKTDVMPTLAEVMGSTVPEAQSFLFMTYQPDRIWWGIAAIGVISIVGMVIYDRIIRMFDKPAAA
ncbi:MAG: MFS transporter [Proteobacteria bacterium]|nr:MFS transporter [Pseudomonadota bacterium]MCP4919654.1 MFS transporter [Pseudomonadota bacterium]